MMALSSGGPAAGAASPPPPLDTSMPATTGMNDRMAIHEKARAAMRSRGRRACV
jgi:hypothetical protein